MERYAVILAAGRGSRMKSKDENTSKVSYPILGKPLIKYVLDAVEPLNPSKEIVVVGFGGEKTKSLVEDKAEVVWQEELLGTGHALMQAATVLKDKKGHTIVLCGDTPLITTDTLKKLVRRHEKYNASLTILTAVLENPKSYGRILRDKTNRVVAIREDEDCTNMESFINEVNTGVYVFDNELLFKYIYLLNNENAQKEFYLTDLVEIFHKNNHKIDTLILEDPEETFGINDRFQLSYAGKVMRKRINKQLMMSGVWIEDTDTTYISPDVTIGKDTIIHPNTSILGKCIIGERNIIGSNSYIEECIIGNDNKILSSYLTETTIGNNNEVGPYTKTRAHTVISDNCRVGNFVELKNAILKPGVKCAHLSYLGDSEVGERTNIGCMTVTANYDGYNKTRTTIGKDVFVGSGTILVAPVTIGDEGFTAAGSTITKDVESQDMAIARARQVELKGYAPRFKAKAKAIKEGKK